MPGPAARMTIRAAHVTGARVIPHTYWYVYFGQGNVAQNIFEGDAPPPPPPTDPGPFVIDRNNCQQILGMFCPKA